MRPFASLDIVVENRCFNGGLGSSFLWVNNQLAAFSRVNGDIYDCHGQRLWETCYSCWIDSKPKLKISTDSGTYIWASDRPSYAGDAGTQIVYGQPEDLVCASISSDYTFTILNSLSPACDPRLLIMTYAIVCFLH